MSKHWYRTTAANYDCNDHPRPPTQLVDLFAAHTGISIEITPHILDKLRHLSHCLGESENLTLFRLQQGHKQCRKVDDEV